MLASRGGGGGGGGGGWVTLPIRAILEVYSTKGYGF